MMNIETLEDYAVEIGVEINLDQLIKSHRLLRELNMKSSIERIENMEKARQLGMKQGYEIVTTREYIKVSTLKNLSVGELVELIGDYE